MNSIIVFVAFLSLCMVSVISTQGYIILTRVDPKMQGVLPPTNLKNEMEKSKVGNLRMVNNKMYSGKRGGKSNDMFKHFFDYISQIQNDGVLEEWRINEPGTKINKDLSDQNKFTLKGEFQRYPMSFIDIAIYTRYL